MKNKAVIIGGLSLLFGMGLLRMVPVFAASQISEKEMGVVFGAECNCDNCHYIGSTFYECFHEKNFPELEPCGTTKCFRNLLSSATCDTEAEVADCGAHTNYGSYGLIQEVYEAANCASSNYDWHIWYRLYVTDHCGTITIRARCDTSSSCENGKFLESNPGFYFIECD